MVFPWVRNLFCPRRRPTRRPLAPPPRPTFRPMLERLEGCIVPATLTVTNTNDSGAGSLRAQVAAAQPGDTINFAPALANQTITLTTGQIPVNQSVTIDGQNNNIVINGNENGRIFEIGGGSTATINNLTLYNGQVVDSNGGAILVDKGAGLKLTGDTFTSNNAVTNQADADGGAIQNNGSLGVTNCTFTGNNASSSGGAIESNSTGAGGNGSLTVNGSVFDGNSAGIGAPPAVAGYGGAIDTYDNTTLNNDGFGDPDLPNMSMYAGGAVHAARTGTSTPMLNVYGCTFQSNQVTSAGGGGAGGAIEAYNVTLNVATSSFIGNTANGGNGGAIDFDLGSSSPTTGLFLVQDTFTANSSAKGNGGAVSSQISTNSGVVDESATYCTFSNNSAASGSGGALYFNNSAQPPGSNPLIFNNDTLFQDTATSGGGMYLDLTGPSSAALTNLTITGNTVGNQSNGSGLWLSAPINTVSVDNCIIDANGNFGVNFTLAGTTTLQDLGYNLVGSSDDGIFKLATDFTNSNTGLVKSLGNDGAKPGYPQTLALTNASPGYKTGDPKQAGALDERGYTRQTGMVSIGAEDPNAL